MKRWSHFAKPYLMTLWAVAILVGPGINRAGACPLCHNPSEYKVIDLGLLPGKTDTQITDSAGCLNNQGQVVGWSFAHHMVDDVGFVWHDGKMTSLPPCRPVGACGPRSINDWGQIVATAGPTYNDLLPFVLRGRTWVELPRPEGYANAFAVGINNRGNICGYSWRNGGMEGWEACLPLLWRRGNFEILRTLELPNTISPAGSCFALNDRDQVVGQSGDWLFDRDGNFVNSAPRMHAVLWDRGEIVDVVGEQVPWSAAYGISNEGTVVGLLSWDLWTEEWDYRAFRWTKERGMEQLPRLSDIHPFGYAYSVNIWDQIVGVACTLPFPLVTDFTCMKAVLWKDGAVYDLNQFMPTGSDWVLYYAFGINARGQIITQGLNVATGHIHAFLLEPKLCRHGR
jgi:uncharacterized membrane protein